MKLILEIASHAGDGGITHRSVETFPATLGRGYHNDIIITDPHISAQHLRIDFDGQQFSIHDLGSENGLTVNEQHHKSAGTALKSGDTVRAGRTVIRVFDPAHPVPPAWRLQRANPFLVWLARPVTVWAAFAFALALSVVQKYLDSFDFDVAMDLGSTAFFSAIIIILWAALWGVAGKLVRHKSRFRSHVALMSLFVCSMIALASLQAYLDFLGTGKTTADLFMNASNACLTLALLYGSLTLATDMSQKKRRLWTGFFAVGAVLVGVGMAVLDSGNFNPSPTFSDGLEPYLSSLASADSVDGFMKGNTSLFDSDTFKTLPVLGEK